MISKNNDIRIETTTQCNYNCIICPRDRLTRKIETMSLRLFKKVLDRVFSETDQYTTLTFPGMGEPLLDKTLDKKIAYARKLKQNLSVLILTNGSLLTPERFRALEDLGVASIRVSCYATDPLTYARIHRAKNKSVFTSIKNNLLAISKKKRNTKLLLTFNAVDGYNDSVINDWIRFWEDKVDLLEVWKPHNWVDGRNYRSVQKEKLDTCGRPFNGPLQVQVDATVNMCCFDFDGKLTLGDLKKQRLSEIFSSDFYRKIVECHRSGVYCGSGLICENCDQRNLDKNDVAIYNSKFDIKERVKMISTTYLKIN